MIKATGEFQNLICPGIGPFLPQGAAKHFVRPNSRVRKLGPTGIFDSQTYFPPTIFSELYN